MALFFFLQRINFYHQSYEYVNTWLFLIAEIFFYISFFREWIILPCTIWKLIANEPVVYKRSKLKGQPLFLPLFAPITRSKNSVLAKLFWFCINSKFFIFTFISVYSIIIFLFFVDLAFENSRALLNFFFLILQRGKTLKYYWISFHELSRKIMRSARKIRNYILELKTNK